MANSTSTAGSAPPAAYPADTSANWSASGCGWLIFLVAALGVGVARELLILELAQ